MTTKRSYYTGCTHCGASGIVSPPYNPYGCIILTNAPCPECLGNKMVRVEKTTNTMYNTII